MEKLIITAAICGAEVTKENNPAVPYTVEEIAREAKSAYDAGAAVIHLHVREDDGTPTQNHERFQKCVDAILKECPDAIIQPSTGGAMGMTAMERFDSTNITPTPESASFSCGSCNFDDVIFENTVDTIQTFATEMKKKGVKPEIECFEKGWVDMAVKLNKKGYLDAPMHFSFVLGVTMTATIRDLSFLVDSLPAGSTWSVCAVGKAQFEMAAAAIVMGGHVRVGLEDNLYLEKGVLAKSNGELVAKAVTLAKLLGREIATPDEAREILGLKK